MKKKLLILLALLVAMTLVFVACKDDPQPPVDDTTVADQPTEEPTNGEEDPSAAPDTDPETPEPGTDEPDEPTTPAPDTQEPDTPAPDTQAPETPEPETKDPMEPVNVFDAEDIQTVTGGDPNNMTQDCLTLEDGYIHVVPIGPDPYWYPFAGVDGARYVAIRYRTDATGADIQMYIGSTGGGPDNDSTMLRQPVIADSEWHVAIFDTQSLIDAGKYDGKYVSYFRFDALEAGYILDENGQPYKPDGTNYARYTLPEGCSIDVAYIGFFHSEAAVAKYDFEQYPPYAQPGESGLKNVSFDTFYLNNQMYFPEDGGADAKLDAINNTLTFNAASELEMIALRGWIGFDQPIDQFGYYVDNYEFIFGDFKQDTEAGVLAAGGEHATRFQINVDLSYLEGDDHFVGFVVKLADGTVVQLREEIVIDLPELPKDITDSFVSDVNTNEVGTTMDASDLANFFVTELPLPGSGVEANGEGKLYHLTSINDMYADVNGRYFIKANVIDSNGAGWMFARGYKVVNSDEIVEKFDPAGGFYKINNYYETDSAGAMGGAGIYARLQGGKLFLMIKYYNPETITRVGNKIYAIDAAGTELTMADNGATVSILVDGVTYATVELSGSIAYGDINEVDPAGEFAEKAVITLKDGTTETIENTLIAATCQCQVGIVARAGSFKFDALAVGGYSAIEVPALEIVTPEEPEPVDPDAPVLVLDPEYINELAGSTEQTVAQHIGSHEIITEDGVTFVRLTSNGGDPYVALVKLGSYLELPPYMAFAYRTNCDLDAHVFIGSGSGWNGQGDVTSVAWNQDNNWNLAVLDLNNAGLTSIQGGIISYCRFDFFTGNGVGNMDVEYVAFFNSAEAAQKYYDNLHKADEPEVPETPKMPAEFSLSLNQVNLGKTLYFSGAMSGYYFAASENPADAVKVYSEAVEGGYRMYFMDGETKTYLDIVYRDKNKANVVLTTDPVGVYVWNEEANTWTVTIPEAEATFYLGTYNSYNTISASSVSYITGDNAANVGVTQFVAQWADVPPPHEHNYEYETIVIDPTCTEDGYTVHKCECGDGYIDNEIPAAGHNFVDGSCGICGAADPDYVDPDAPAADNATIDFSTTDQRIEYSTTVQVWKNGSFVLTNNKADSTSNIGDYCKPARFYANTELIIAFPGMTKIVIDANSGKPVDGWVNCINDSNATVTKADNIVTIEFAAPVDSFTIIIGAQVRANAISVYAEKTPDEPAANEIQVTTTDTYGWFDEYTFVADAAGNYTFTLPAGLGMWSIASFNSWGDPELDYNMAPDGGDVTVALAAGEEFKFLVGAFTKGDWTITYTFAEGEVGGGDEPGTEDPETPVEPAGDISGTYSTGGDDTLVIDMAAGTMVYTFTGNGGAQNVVEYGISITDGVVTLSNANGPITGPMAVYMGVLELDENGKPAKFYYNGYTYDVTAAGAVEPEPEQPEVGDLILVIGDNNITITDEIIAEGGIVYQLVVTEEGTYTVKGDFFVQFQDAMGMTYGNGSYLPAGTYDVRLGTMLISAAGNYNAEVEFTAPEGGDVVEPDPEPSGNPVIESLPFSYEVPAEGLSMDGVYYDYTAAEQITLVITKPAGGLVSPTATNNWDNDADGNYVLVVNAGETISLNFWSMSGITEGVFTVSVQA